VKIPFSFELGRLERLVRVGILLGCSALVGCDATVIGGGSGVVDEGDEEEDGDDRDDGEDDGADGPSRGAGVGCSLVGLWDGVSPGYNDVIPESRATYRFDTDGTWLGGPEGSDAASGAFMSGTYAVADDTLSLEGEGMTQPGYDYSCPGTAEATFGLAFSADCNEATVVTRTDNCTGARHYLSASSVGSVLVRR
jgi:hypothetical protein